METNINEILGTVGPTFATVADDAGNVNGYLSAVVQVVGIDIVIGMMGVQTICLLLILYYQLRRVNK